MSFEKGIQSAFPILWLLLIHSSATFLPTLSPATNDHRLMRSLRLHPLPSLLHAMSAGMELWPTGMTVTTPALVYCQEETFGSILGRTRPEDTEAEWNTSVGLVVYNLHSSAALPRERFRFTNRSTERNGVACAIFYFKNSDDLVFPAPGIARLVFLDICDVSWLIRER